MPFADQVPVNSAHSIDALAQVGCPDHGIDSSALRAVCPSQLHITPVGRRDPALGRERDRFPVTFPPGHHGPHHPRELVGKRDGGNLGRAPCQQGRAPGPMPGAVDLGIADHGQRAGGEQAA